MFGGRVCHISGRLKAAVAVYSSSGCFGGEAKVLDSRPDSFCPFPFAETSPATTTGGFTTAEMPNLKIPQFLTGVLVGKRGY